MAPARARYSAWCCAAAVTRSSERTAGAPIAARRSLCTRNIAAVSFDRGALLSPGDGVTDAVGPGAAETATVAGLAVAATLDASTRPEVAGACGLAMYLASATPTASAETSAKGTSVRNVPGGIGHIFMERDRRSESNGAQRHAQSRT